jgi:phosphoglycerate kinase
MATKTIADINVAGKTVLMRVDFNVPLAEGKVSDDRRIQMALPSIQKVLDEGGKLILMSHLGRPDGEVDMEFSLAPVAKRLGEFLGKKVLLGPNTVVDDRVKDTVKGMKAGDVLLLENIRFHPGETSKEEAVNKAFSEQLGALGDVYVNDAFGTCHRKHASMYGAARAIQAKGGPAVAGILVEREIRYLHEAVASPVRPFTAILGGAKVSDKIKLIAALLNKVDRIIIGGAMAYTLLKAQGFTVGKSLVEEDQVEEMKSLLAKAGDKIMLPCDHVGAEEFGSDDAKKVEGTDIPDNLMGMDIGPKTIQAFSEVIAKSKTVVWNGPMGVFERAVYAAGTKAIAEAVALATDNGAVTVIGGGDSASAVKKMGLAARMTHVSTGGGASLTYMEGKPMPPLEVLDQK